MKPKRDVAVIILYDSDKKVLLQHRGEDGNHSGQMYVYMELCRDKQSLQLHEGKGWGWFRIPETKDLKMVDHDREVLEYIGGNF